MTIHDYATETDLWTSLAVNIWAIFAAIFYVWQGNQELATRLARAAGWGLIALGFIAVSVLSKFGWQSSDSLPEMLYNAIGGGGFGVLILLAGVWVLTKNPKKQAS